MPAFTRPQRGFVSTEPAPNWEHSLLTGNGTLGAMVPGHAHDEVLYLSHAGLYLPSPQADAPVEMAARLATIRELCLAGRYVEAGAQITAARDTANFTEERDRFIAACALVIEQPQAEVTAYQRSVDWLSAEATVAVKDTNGSFTRSVFASRANDVLVVRLQGDQPLSASFGAMTLPTASEEEQAIVDAGIREVINDASDQHVRYRTLFTAPNPDNPLIGYEMLARVVASGGSVQASGKRITISNADEILVLITITLLTSEDDLANCTPQATARLAELPSDYAQLLAAHQPLHQQLMEGRLQH